jgi:hypothetical protein
MRASKGVSLQPFQQGESDKAITGSKTVGPHEEYGLSQGEL